jgi:ribokinase
MTGHEVRSDVAVVGAPFIDLVFEDLPSSPAVDRELLARRLLVTVGGTALQAIAATRAGARTALVAPRGTDRFGTWAEEMVASEGVRWLGCEIPATSVTAVLPGPDGTAMVTAASAEEPTAGEVASTQPTGVLLSLGRRHLAPAGAMTFLVTGPAELDAGMTLDAAEGADAVIVNAREASALTATDDVEEAVRGIGEVATIAVVTLGARGALAIHGGRVVRARPTSVSSGDATGAGDVFAGTFAASLVLGAPLQEALDTATRKAARAAAGATAWEGLGPRLLTPP